MRSWPLLPRLTSQTPLANGSKSFYHKAPRYRTHRRGRTKLVGRFPTWTRTTSSNFPKDANTYNSQRDCKLRNCIIEAIAWYVQVLKSPDAPRNEKRIALRFVVHLVGDIHQPLHAGFAEDRGGNSVDVRFNGRKESLHSLWDTALVELEQGTPAEIAKRIQAAVTSDDVNQWQQGTPAEWALESLAIVRAQVYRLTASGEITASYTERARAVIRTRLMQAGIRLAWML